MRTMHRQNAPAIDPGVIRQAARWLALLHSGQAAQADHDACRRWRQADAAHEQAWQKAERLSLQFGAVPASVGVPVLARQARVNRRAALKTLALLGGTVSAGALGWRLASWGHLTSDYRTATGESRDLLLDDGSKLALNTGTALDVRYSNEERLIRLQQGEIYVQTAPDAAGRARPFLVQTRHGRLRALGTRFVVRQVGGEQDATCIEVLEHRVEISPQGGAAPVVLEAGRRACFTSAFIEAPRAVAPAPAVGVEPSAAPGWTRGVLYADRTRLADFLQELSRYRPGIVRCDPAVAGLRLSGVFQLADTDRVLDIVQQTLPVRVVRRTPYWITVAPAAG
ncbi:heme uptake transmembrane sensor [Bordetella ansorpii]|jgi:transmembrane sensor|uniref:Heme uptake transmembrane sensor n=2 Tax=Bordetella ansorpii TaxID=288768 RepID=A0A157QUZ9_9BORD|nr:heme uptake transmembrane sensor [Bordetella ansorpii]